MTSRFLLAVALIATPAFAAPTHQSTAQDFDAQFVDAGVSTTVGPFTLAVGKGAGPYNQSAAAAPENEVIALVPQNPTPSIFLNLGKVQSQATSTGILLDSESWGGNAAVDKIAVALNLNPLPPGGVPAPFLQITAHDVKAQVGMNIVFPSTRGASGSAKIGSLDIFGSAMGFAAVHYSGAPAPNTVVYDTPTVTITLNKRIESGLISCSPTCVFTVTSIETDAADIDLHKAPWQGHKITGDIVIGRATAE
jgi:hypothetical protein